MCAVTCTGRAIASRARPDPRRHREGAPQSPRPRSRRARARAKQRPVGGLRMECRFPCGAARGAAGSRIRAHARTGHRVVRPHSHRVLNRFHLTDHHDNRGGLTWMVGKCGFESRRARDPYPFSSWPSADVRRRVKETLGRGKQVGRFTDARRVESDVLTKAGKDRRDHTCRPRLCIAPNRSRPE